MKYILYLSSIKRILAYNIIAITGVVTLWVECNLNDEHISL